MTVMLFTAVPGARRRIDAPKVLTEMNGLYTNMYNIDN